MDWVQFVSATTVSAVTEMLALAPNKCVSDISNSIQDIYNTYYYFSDFFETNDNYDMAKAIAQSLRIIRTGFHFACFKSGGV